ncbi:MAG: SOS response-associated peptidase [Rhodospirillales bacterium]|nr:SOS response-associated peptidase [Rhodospirillales bacterium]MCB9996199.1 SOS response-associated peptidase [Rhodospirillales bacterium]
MCGRYAFFTPPAKLKDLFGTDNLSNFPARYNAAPLQQMPVIIRHRMGMARWGFLPGWAREDDKALAAKMINARSETVAEKASFRESWAKGRRCLVPANGFYEWVKDQQSGQKQAYYISHPARDCMAFAGLWSKAGDVVTYTILTKDADGPVAALHHRSPVLIDPARAADWFNGDACVAMDLARQSRAHDLVFHPVDGKVGKVANDSEDLIMPLTAHPSAA